jgi:hypothetical protein
MKRSSLPSPAFSPVRRVAPTRLAVLSVFSALCLTALPSRADEKAVDLASLKVGLPANAGATSEVTTDELDKVPVLKLQFPDGEFEAWKGSVRYEVAAPSAGSYQVTFQAKTEPADNYFDLRVWDLAASPVKKLAEPKGLKFTTDWQDFAYEFTVPEDHTGPATITLGNLARPGTAVYIRNVVLNKL